MVAVLSKEISVEEISFIRERKENLEWTPERIRGQVAELGPWAYYFEFSHDLTTAIHGDFNDATRVFHRYRSKLISETVVELLGSYSAQSTLLDLACHCGVMALDVATRGLKHVAGVDCRLGNVKQANFLKDYYRVDNVSFSKADVYDMPDYEVPFDVILCLGILYHVVRPVDLLEYCYRNSKRFVVVDTLCDPSPGSLYRVVRGKSVQSTIEGTRPIEFLPTYQAVVDTMEEAGFREIVEVVGRADQPVVLYPEGYRRCFVGFK